MLLFHSVSYGQEVQFDATVSQTSCDINQNIQLTYTFNENGDLELPELKNGKYVAGPMTGQSTSISIVNGRKTVEKKYTYTYYIKFTKKGDQVIPAAKLTVNGKSYKTNPITINVGGSGTSDNSNVQADKNIFLTVSLNKNKIYKGEHVVVTYKLYSRYVRYQHQTVDMKFNTPQGFWKQDIENAGQLKMNEEVINGKKYGVVALKKQVLYAQNEGSLKIDPFKMTVRVSDFFNSEDFDMTSNSPTIEVLPLPEGAPEGFNGAVGKFNFEVAYSKSELKVNEGLDITINIRGNGNIKLLDDFVLQLPNEMEKFDPEISDTVNVTAGGMSGKRTYKYLIIPQASGKYKLPPVSFSYFDPESKKYKSISSNEFELKVLKADGSSDNTVIRKQGQVKILDKEIRHLREYTNDKREKGNYLFGTGLFFTGILGGPLLFLLFVFIKKKNEKDDSQLNSIKVKKATKVAIKQMQTAKNLLDTNNLSAFNDEAIKTLYTYTGLKLGLPTSDFNKDNIRKKMEAKNVDATMINQFVHIIELCEMSKFGATQTGQEKVIYEESIRLIESLEEKL